MVIANLDMLVANRHYKEIDGGNGLYGHYLLYWDGREVFYKPQKPTQNNNKKGLVMKGIRALDQLAISFLVSLRYDKPSVIDYPESGIEKEVRTIKAWRDAGIVVPEIIGHDQNAVAYGYIREAMDYSKLLQDGDKPKEFRALADTYHRIRSLAKTKNNTDLLHSDPVPSNFLYIPSKGLAIPIDPHLALKAEKSFEEVDAVLNLSFLYLLLNLQAGPPTLRGYLKEFIERLELSEAKRMREYNREGINNHLILAPIFFRLREPIAALIMNRPKRNLNEILNGLSPNYDKNKAELINEVLEKRIAA